MTQWWRWIVPSGSCRGGGGIFGVPTIKINSLWIIPMPINISVLYWYTYGIYVSRIKVCTTCDFVRIDISVLPTLFRLPKTRSTDTKTKVITIASVPACYSTFVFSCTRRVRFETELLDQIKGLRIGYRIIRSTVLGWVSTCWCWSCTEFASAPTFFVMPNAISFEEASWNEVETKHIFFSWKVYIYGINKRLVSRTLQMVR